MRRLFFVETVILSRYISVCFLILFYHFVCTIYYLSSFTSIIEHDDSLTDREEGGILDTNFQATKTLWFEKFNVNYYVQGGMYRGEPPADFYTAEWVHSSSKTKNHNDKVAVGAGDRYMITISKLIENNDWDGVFMYSQQVGLHHHVVNNGASSVGRDEESSLTWKSIDYPDSFIAPVAKTIGVNANIKKDDYVFGNGGMFLFSWWS